VVITLPFATQYFHTERERKQDPFHTSVLVLPVGYITYNLTGYTSNNILFITVCDTIMVKSMILAAARKCQRHLLLFEDVFIRNLCPYRSAAHLAATLPSGRMINVPLPIE
jgi:hypothetical protein